MKDLFPQDLKESNNIPLLEQVADRVADLLDRDPELLFSYLYRLDVTEDKVARVIQQGGEGLAQRIAQLILDRQEKRQKTKRAVDVPRNIDAEGLEW